MTIGSRLITGVCAAVVLSTAVGLLVQRAAIRQQGIDATLATMRAAVAQAEGARGMVAFLQQREAFDRDKLLREFRQGQDLRSSTIYATVPVVAAWRGIETVAKQEGYRFRVPKHQARNPKNAPQGNEIDILRRLENGESELIIVDEDQNRLTYARPIRLTAECLSCHGDPATSPTHDGRDVLGYRMEGWKAGEVHGAFVLSSDLGKVDAVVGAGVLRVFGWMAPVALLVCLATVFASRRWIIRPLESAVRRVAVVSQQTAAASTQIASASQQLAEGASQQAATLEETSATLQEVAAGGRRNRQGADAARQAASAAADAAQEGVDKTRELHEAIEAVQKANGNVGAIAKTIDEMAFQTNLLAINAAIEAARAGDAGLGFGVVADEVRALAARSSKAVDDTSRQVNAALAQARHGVEVSHVTLTALEQIAAQSGRSREAVECIATATESQASSLGHLEGNLKRIDAITQNNAANAEENAAASEQLAANALELNATVRDMSGLLGIAVA